MLGYHSITRNQEGTLQISGCDCKVLAEKYGTPLYVMDEGEIRRRCKEIKMHHMDKYNGFAVYASKAFLNKEMCRIIKSEGIGLDVVSGGELFTARAVDFPMENILFHGNNKSEEELAMALEYGVGRIVVDNFLELETLARLATAQNKCAAIMLRVSPGIDGHTHEYIQTGQVDSKFGFSIFDGAATRAVETALSLSSLKLVGIHAHLGSQLLENDIYRLEGEVLAKFARDLLDRYEYQMPELNVGGGFGIYYTEQDHRKELSFFTEMIHQTVQREFKANGLSIPKVIIEPGRWLVGEAGITLYKIGAIKEITGLRKYVSVDGGMADNLRPPLYDAEYTAVMVEQKGDGKEEVVSIAGKCCESGDILLRDVSLPVLSSGDLLAVLSTGAYNYSMSSNYNRLRKPAVVMVHNGMDRLAVKRETYEDLLRNDL